MKYRVVGWTFYDDRDLEEGENSWASNAAIVDDIKKHGYIFTGWDHQENLNCTPVLNDGKMRRFSQRGFGGIMAEAHGHNGMMDYSLFAFSIDDKGSVMPRDIFNAENFVPETNLNESFTVDITEELYETAKNRGKIKMNDLSELRYLGAGDSLVLRCGKRTAEYLVIDLERKKDLTDGERLKLESAMYDHADKERRKRAEEKFNNTKIALSVTLKAK